MSRPLVVKTNRTLYLDYEYGIWDPDCPRDFRGIPSLKYGEDYEYMRKGTKLTVYTEPQDIERFIDRFSLNAEPEPTIALAVGKDERQWMSFRSMEELDKYPYFDVALTETCKLHDSDCMACSDKKVCFNF